MVVTGSKKHLQQSQSYPRDFGAAVAETFIQNFKTPANFMSLFRKQELHAVRSLLRWAEEDDLWKDAQLESVEAYLRSGAAGTDVSNMGQEREGEREGERDGP